MKYIRIPNTCNALKVWLCRQNHYLATSQQLPISRKWKIQWNERLSFVIWHTLTCIGHDICNTVDLQVYDKLCWIIFILLYYQLTKQMIMWRLFVNAVELLRLLTNHTTSYNINSLFRATWMLKKCKLQCIIFLCRKLYRFHPSPFL